ncbi:MAG: extracellular solute-binding protein [Pseudomonadota bacterium]
MTLPGPCRALRRIAHAALAMLVAFVAPASGAGEHGVSPFGAVKYGPDFAAFDYVNPEAPQGGLLRIATTTGFDTLNPIAAPGRTPNILAASFDSLMVRAADEPASYYGLLAERIELSDDLSTLRIGLRPEARWHDGWPVTAKDVRFTFDALRQHGFPSVRRILEPIEIEVEDATNIVFRNAVPGSWRFLDTVATFPIQSARFWQQRAADRPLTEAPMGSGPYRVVRIDMNNRIALERIPDYWARGLAVNRGRWNFARIEAVRFRDGAARLEALRTGSVDLVQEANATLWQKGYVGPGFETGQLVRSTLPRPGGAQAVMLIFNQRRAPLDDRRVRAALSLAFDGRWTREVLFGGLYTPAAGFYGGTPLAAVGPAGPLERALLAPYAGHFPDALLETPFPPTPLAANRRTRLSSAAALLEEAGWRVVDGRRVDPKTGAPLTVKYLGAHPDMARVLTAYGDAFERLGIALKVEIPDFVSARRRILDHDFDLTMLGWQPRLPHGEQERLFWHSGQAGTPSYGLAGLQNPAVDAAIDAMGTARGVLEVQPAARALDRLLRWNHATIPLWSSDQVWIAHTAMLSFPVSPQVYADPVETWWLESQ